MTCVSDFFKVNYTAFHQLQGRGINIIMDLERCPKNNDGLQNDDKISPKDAQISSKSTIPQKKE